MNTTGKQYLTILGRWLLVPVVGSGALILGKILGVLYISITGEFIFRPIGAVFSTGFDWFSIPVALSQIFFYGLPVSVVVYAAPGLKKTLNAVICIVDIAENLHFLEKHYDKLLSDPTAIITPATVLLSCVVTLLISVAIHAWLVISVNKTNHPVVQTSSE